MVAFARSNFDDGADDERGCVDGESRPSNGGVAAEVGNPQSSSASGVT